MTASSNAAPALSILVPLDGSQHARLALEAATRLHPARITLIQVEVDNGMILPDVALDQDAQRLRDMRESLEGAAEALRATGIQADAIACSGDPAEEIIAAASDVDLIVMTTRGRGAASRALFGSVADRVSRSSTVPTMLIRTGETEELRTPTRIVAPLDGSPTSERALPIAARLARAISVPIHLMRSIDLDDVRATIRSQKDEGIDTSGQTYDDARAETERRVRSYLETHQRALAGEGLEVAVKTLDGTPSFALLWEITPDDLVVMSSHGRSGYRRWLLGSVAEKLVREAKAPVVMVPTRDTPPA